MFRRKKPGEQPFPESWRQTLRRDVAFYSYLPEPDRIELEQLTQLFVAEKRFEGCGGFTVTEEAKVCVAAQACLLLLRRTSVVFEGLYSVLVYPTSYWAPSRRYLGSGIVEERYERRSGQAWEEGSVIVSWDGVCAGGQRGAAHNLVLHEFAHLLDFEDGWRNGTPRIRGLGGDSNQGWTEVLTAEFDKLRAQAQAGTSSCLDFYGATNPVEFFAVATETFFMQPHALKRQSPELYGQLQQYYAQNPEEWMPPPES